MLVTEEMLEQVKLKVVTRFMQYVNKQDDNPNSCWLWIGRKRRPIARVENYHSQNYGSFTLNGKEMFAHRVSYFLFIGPLESGMVIMHKCNTPECVNPHHLKQGTQSENISHAFQCGLMVTAKGQTHPKAKLDNVDVYEIRRLYFEEQIGSTTLGRRFGVSATSIRNIILGKTWRHLK